MFALVDGNSFYASVEQVFDLDAARRPVVVLSNNDGCVVAASKDAKALDVEMFRPFFQVKDRLAGHNVRVFSSNYTLYDDMQRRMVDIYRQHAEEVEVYSIDEAFLTLGRLPARRLMHWGDRLRRTVRQWTGVPVGVGVALTKLLAKLANRMSKRDPMPGQPEGVCVLVSPHAVDVALGRVELSDLWGVSRGFVRRLAKMGITTPRAFRDADPARVREHLGIVGQRMVYELRGEPCLEIETLQPDRKNVCVSRSFGQVIEAYEPLREAVATFASQAAVKLRRQDLAAHAVVAFVQTDRHAPVEQYANSHGVRLTVASFDSRELSRAAGWCLSRIYRPEHAYKKAGVMLLDLEKRERVQPGLFDRRDHAASHRLMGVMDRINRDHGGGTIRIASSSPFNLRPCRTWHLRREHCSPRYTTRWDELPEARCVGEPQPQPQPEPIPTTIFSDAAPPR
ncbi:MAG: Y-family DNA polymerase [Phycisphaeraceae bacterium]